MDAILRWWNSDASLWHIFAAIFVMAVAKAMAGTTGPWDSVIHAAFSLGLAVAVVLERRAHRTP